MSGVTLMKHKKKTDDKVPTLSAKEALVLELLLRMPASAKYGLEMVAESNGQLSRGTIYVTLGRMEDKGYVESRPEEPDRLSSGIPRRLYRVTGYGQRVFQLWQMARELGRLHAAGVEVAL
jgi:DNA-binding PadR family transcriptional regulator